MYKYFNSYLLKGFKDSIKRKVITAMKKEKTLKRPGRVGFILVSVLLAVVLAINIVVVAVLPGYYNLANHFLGNNQLKDEASEAAKAESAAVTEEIEEEGIVLLENKNNTLPLTGTDKINVFGYIGNDVVYGGSGSGSGDSSENVSLREGLENSGFEVNGELMDFYA